jgi:hypothetical protein
MGVAVQNVGGSIQTGATAARLPRALRFGAAAPFAPGESFSLVATADVVMARATEAVGGGGMEVVWRATPSLSVAARVGGMALPADHDGSPFTGGGAVIGRSIALDYAFRSFDAAGGGMHRIGIRWWR